MAGKVVVQKVVGDKGDKESHEAAEKNVRAFHEKRALEMAVRESVMGGGYG